MHYCPNPICRRNIRQTKKPFSSAKSVSIHVQLSPDCKAFVFGQNATAMNVSSLEFPPKQAPIDSKSNLFKKQRLRLNPAFLEPEVSNIAYLHDIDDKTITVDNDDDASDNNLHQMNVEADVNSVASNGSVAAVDSFSENKFVDTTKAPAGDSDYACFTTSQKCITSLMYLLDDMECPDYAFQCIMDWARNCFEAGFDFNPKSKTHLGNLKWI